jgi:hypothetical protein
VPAGCTVVVFNVVVFNVVVLPYLPRNDRAAFVEMVRAMPVRWIAREARGTVPGTEGAPPGGWGSDFVLSLAGRPATRTHCSARRVDRLAA